MFTPEDFLDTIALETRICKHLNDKLTGDQLTYRPAEGMRSTLELLHYLTYCAILPAHAIVEDDWAAARERATAAKSVTAATFAEHMDRQLDEVRSLVSGLSEQDLGREVTLPWGVTAPLGRALVDTALRFLTAYRMQLFVYAKASGDGNLATSNCWLGVDPPPAD